MHAAWFKWQGTPEYAALLCDVPIQARPAALRWAQSAFAAAFPANPVHAIGKCSGDGGECPDTKLCEQVGPCHSKEAADGVRRYVAEAQYSSPKDSARMGWLAEHRVVVEDIGVPNRPIFTVQSSLTALRECIDAEMAPAQGQICGNQERCDAGKYVRVEDRCERCPNRR